MAGILWRAIVESLDWVGTPVRAVVIALLSMFIVGAVVWIFRGKEELRSHVRDNVLIASAGSILVWLAVFGYFALYKVPKEIYSESGHVAIPHLRLPRPPAFAFVPVGLSPTDPVTITPEQVTFGPAKLSSANPVSEQYTFRISARNRDVYGISFQFLANSAAVPAKNFGFDVPKSSWRALDETTPSGSKFGDISGMQCVDTHGRFVFLGFLKHLSPDESREVRLIYANGPVQTTTKNGKIPSGIPIPDWTHGVSVRSRILDFSLKPLPVIHQGGVDMVLYGRGHA